MIELTLERTKALLQEAVAERGEGYVYTNPEGESGMPLNEVYCFYVHGDAPGCIAGYVLHKAGVPLATLQEHERDPADTVAGSLEAQGVLDTTMDVHTLLREAQRKQDAGTPWGEAVQGALRLLDLVNA